MSYSQTTTLETKLVIILFSDIHIEENSIKHLVQSAAEFLHNSNSNWTFMALNLPK